VIRIAAFVLADAATVREGLLNVLGAGVNVLIRPSYPAELGVPLVALLELEPEDMKAHTVEVTIQADSTALTRVEVRIDTGVSGPFGDLPAYVPLVVPVADAVLPGAGRYEATLTVDDQLLAVLAFRAELAPDSIEQPSEPRMPSPTDLPPFM
jgi:hypothetical protein